MILINSGMTITKYTTQMNSKTNFKQFREVVFTIVSFRQVIISRLKDSVTLYLQVKAFTKAGLPNKMDTVSNTISQGIKRIKCCCRGPKGWRLRWVVQDKSCAKETRSTKFGVPNLFKSRNWARRYRQKTNIVQKGTSFPTTIRWWYGKSNCCFDSP